MAHPHSPIPVLLNDVFFAVHALFACLLTVLQCLIYYVSTVFFAPQT